MSQKGDVIGKGMSGVENSGKCTKSIVIIQCFPRYVLLFGPYQHVFHLSGNLAGFTLNTALTTAMNTVN